MATSLRRTVPLLAACAFACVLPSGARAGERTLAEDLAAARAQMKAEQWEDAAASFRRSVESRPGSPEVLDRLPEIEEDLEVCLFRRQARRPGARDLFGPAAKSLNNLGRKLVLEYPRGPAGPDWIGSEEGFQILPVRFEGEVCLEFDSFASDDEAKPILALLCYDPDKATGYAVVPGFDYSDGRFTYRCPSSIAKLGKGKREEILRKEGSEMPRAGGNRRYRISWKGSRIEVQQEGTLAFGKNDGAFRSGVVGLLAHTPRDLVVSGTLEEMAFKALVTGYYDREFKGWVKSSYSREEALPSWVLQARAAPAAEAPLLLPADQAMPPEAAIREALAAWSRGDQKGYLKAVLEVRAASPGTVLYLEGLANLGQGALAEAEKRFSALVRKYPAFGPGWLYRGWIRLRRRDLAGAREDLDSAWDGARTLPDLYGLAASLSLAEGNRDEALEACTEARRAGAASPRLGALEESLRRSQRGPAWQKTYEQRDEVAVIDSDHSQKVCYDAGLLLRATLNACDERFARKRPPSKPLRIHVFSGRQAFLDYARAIGANLESAAGAYLGTLEEMVLFLPEVQREDLWRTMKHESFHYYLHGFLETVPPWLDEGYAQWFENGHARGEALLLGGIEAGAALRLREVGVGGLTPLKDLLHADHAAFMEKADIHYPECLALVQYMNETGSPWKARLQAYFDSLLAGLSAKEAFDQHWAADLPRLEEGFHAWLLGVFRSVDKR